MASGFSVGGLISGLDSNSIISQLISIERQPITRLNEQISAHEKQRDAIKDLRSKMQTLRNRAQDFRLMGVFDKFQATSSETKVLTPELSGGTPVIGSYTVNVIQLASATTAGSSATLGSPVNTTAPINSSGLSTAVTEGTFTVNGVQFTVGAATTLSQVLSDITASAAGVNATYDAVSDTITLENKNAGDTSIINLGATGDTSNMLDALNIKKATQSTGGNGSTSVTSTRNLGAIDPSKALDQTNFAGGAITAGTFMVNGVSFTVDPTTDTLEDVLSRITGSDAQVSASYDSATDTIRFVSKNLGSRTIGFNAGTSNFLSVTNLATATQTAGKDAQFTINGGAVLTRNSNEVADAVGGITLRLLSVGESTITVSGDDDAIVENIEEFLTAFNEAVDSVRSLVGAGGTLRGDASIQSVEMMIRDLIMSPISGLSGDYTSLIDIGISSGSNFDLQAVPHLELDADDFREALRADRSNVQSLFSNIDTTGAADLLFSYLDGITMSTGFLNDRSKANGSIDQQIRMLQDQIDRTEDRVAKKEERLRRQFSQLEQLSSGFQSQSSALSGLSSLYTSFR